MFAGPNGPGKSIIKAKIESLNKNWLGINVNPDENEAEIRRNRPLMGLDSQRTLNYGPIRYCFFI